MSDETDPPRKFYGLKPREFERINATPPVAAVPAPAEPNAANGAIPPDATAPGPIDLRAIIRAADSGGPALNRGPRATPHNDVHSLLHDNAARAEAAGLNELGEMPKRSSRRTRDYWLSLVLGNGAIVGAVLLLGPNIVTLMFGLGGVVIFSAALTWIMWFVMDKY